MFGRIGCRQRRNRSLTQRLRTKEIREWRALRPDGRVVAYAGPDDLIELR
jgi:hypothetical protein